MLITGTTGSATTSSKTRKFRKVELIFGPAFPATIDARGGNQECNTRKCIQSGNTYLATNKSYQNNQSNPAGNFDGCRWNADNNNKSWFYFVASGTTAVVSLSGLESQQQSVVVKSSPINGCLSTCTSIPTGGCPDNMFSSSVSGNKYYNSGYSAGNGFRWNHEYSLSGLSPGAMYIFVIEGSNNAQSNFMIDITSGASGGCSPLPITLLSFDATPSQKGVSLNWSTASEKNNDFFTISRSSDLENWEEIGRVSGRGNSNTKINYEFTDVAPLDGISYYQLKQTDYNGENETFDPVSVSINTNHLSNSVLVYPNPTKAGFDIQVYSQKANEAQVSIHSMTGRNVISQNTHLVKGKNSISMKDERLDQGVYLVTIQFEDGTNSMTKLVVE